MKDVKKLTPEQEKTLLRYVRLGLEIGLKADSSLDEAKVRELTDAHRVMHGVPAATNFEVMDSPMAACRKYKGILTPSNAMYGQHDIGWLINYLFFRVELGLVEETNGVSNLIELTKHVGWMWMDNEHTIVTRRPHKIFLRDNPNVKIECDVPNTFLQVLHGDGHKALEYVDGEGLYAWNGIIIPEEDSWVVTTPREEMDAERVLGITNTEVRSCAMDRLGIDKLFEKLPNKSLDVGQYGDQSGGVSDYTLYEVTFGESQRRYLRMVCPSKGSTHIEAVPPTVSTVAEALNWRQIGVISNDYTLPVIRT
jgi:hypothetical protein